MSNFQINSLILENIKTYKYEEIHFSEGNNVIIGENGAGKSTILESIYISLFGEKVPNRKVADMIRYGEPQGKITIKFTIGENKYRIEDEIIRRDEENATQTQVLYNETLEETVAEGKKAVSLKIEEILGIDSTTFASAVYAMQGEIGQILTSKLSDRKSLFNKLFQIDKFEKTWENLSKVEKLIKGQISTINTQIISLQEDVIDKPNIEKEIQCKEVELKEEKEKLMLANKEHKELTKIYSLIKEKNELYNNLIGQKDILGDEIKVLMKQVGEQIHNLEKSEGDNEGKTLTKIKLILTKKEAQRNKLSILINQYREKRLDITRNLEMIRSDESKLAMLNESSKVNKNNFEETISDFCSDNPELTTNVESWSDIIPDLIKEVENTKNQLLLDKKEREKEEDSILKLEVELSKLRESSEKYNSRIVQRRLMLSKDAGDNWKDIVKELMSTDFDTIIKKQQKNIDKLKEELNDLENKKSIIDEGLKRIQGDLQYLKDLKGKETCPTCKQKLSLESLQILNQELTENRDKLQDNRKKINEKIKENQTKLMDLEKIHADLVKKFDLFSKIKPTIELLEESEKEKKSVDEDIKQIELKFEKLDRTLVENKIKELQDKISEKEAKIIQLRAIKKAIPNLLGTKSKIEIDEQIAKDLESKIKKEKTVFSESELEKITREINDKEKEQIELTELITEINSLMNNQELLNTKTKILSKTETELKEIESIEGFKKRNEIMVKWDDLNKLIASLETSINKMKDEVIPPLYERKNKLEQKEEKLNQLKETQKIEKRKQEIASILRGLMRELPKRLLPNFIERINHTATEILQSIIPGSDIQRIVLDNNYGLSVIRLGNEEKISVLSGGETIIIALALRLAFAKEFSAIDLLILDEPTIFLDERRRGELVSVLERNRLVGQMFVVTHDPDFERISDKIYFITKEAGETNVKPTGDNSEESLDIVNDINLS